MAKWHAPAAAAKGRTGRDACRRRAWGAVHPDLGEDSAARLQRGEVEKVTLEHLDALLHQQSVAVPADAAGAGVERHRLVVAMLLDHVQRYRAGARSETAVGFLQRDDVGIELVEHIDRPLRPALAVGADRLSHIVAGHADHCGAAVPGRPHRRKHMAAAWAERAIQEARRSGRIVFAEMSRSPCPPDKADQCGALITCSWYPLFRTML